MGVDSKYGKVTTEFGEIGEDEPVIVFRARDEFLPEVLSNYRLICLHRGSPAHHVDLIDQTLATITRWQAENPEQVRIPNSDAYIRRISEG